MKGLDKEFPEQYFEFDAREDGYGLVVAFDIQGYTTGLLYALKQGWEIDRESNQTVKLGSQFQARIFNQGIIDKLESEVAVVEETKQQEEIVEQEEETTETETESISEKLELNGFSLPEEEGVTYDFEALKALENTKPNRKKVDDLAKAEGIEIDRRKFKTVYKITEEFEKQLNDRNS